MEFGWYILGLADLATIRLTIGEEKDGRVVCLVF
jgi:hypothetical protein